MLEVKDLLVHYDHVQALSGVSFSVRDGDIVTMIGSNGAGKSTLLKTISGMVKKREGSILLDGKPLPSTPHMIVRQGIVHVPEGRRVFSGLTVTENLIMGGVRVPKAEADRSIEEMFEIFPILKTRAKQPAGTLSGGEQQMLAFARGLMAKPRILLLDEPSLGLAPLVVKQVFELIVNMNAMGITILLVEQNALKALGIASYGYVLENGRITMSGESSELMRNPDVQKAYLGE